jgi:TldD protein
MDELTCLAVDTALAAGASYADARYAARKEEELNTKNGQVEGLTSRASRGLGVRVISDGAWGFAATASLTSEAVRLAAQLAVRIAKASATTLRKPVRLAEIQPASGCFSSALREDPFAVPLEDRIALLLDCDRLMQEAGGVSLREGHVELRHEETWFESSEGSRIHQERIDTGAGIETTAVAPDGAETQTRSYPASHGG